MFTSIKKQQPQNVRSQLLTTPSSLPERDVRSKLDFSAYKSPLATNRMLNTSMTNSSRLRDYHTSRQNPAILDYMYIQNGPSQKDSNLIRANTDPNVKSSPLNQYLFPSSTPITEPISPLTVLSGSSINGSSLVQMVAAKRGYKNHTLPVMRHRPVMVKLSSPADNNPRSMEHEVTELPVDPCDKNVIISALKQKRKRWWTNDTSTLSLLSNNLSKKAKTIDYENVQVVPSLSSENGLVNGYSKKRQLSQNNADSALSKSNKKRIILPDIEVELDVSLSNGVFTPVVSTSTHISTVTTTTNNAATVSISSTSSLQRKDTQAAIEEETREIRRARLQKEASLKLESFTPPKVKFSGANSSSPNSTKQHSVITVEDIRKDKEMAAMRVRNLLTSDDDYNGPARISSSSNNKASSSLANKTLTLNEAQASRDNGQVTNISSVSLSVSFGSSLTTTQPLVRPNVTSTITRPILASTLPTESSKSNIVNPPNSSISIPSAGLGIGTSLATTNTGMGLGIGTSLATSNTGMGLGIGTSLATTNTGIGTSLATSNTGMGLGIGTSLATTNTGMGLGIGTSLATSNTGMGLGIGTSLATSSNTGMGLGIGTSLATSNTGMGLGIGTSLATSNIGMGLGIGTSLATSSNTGMGLGIGTSLATSNTGMGLGIGTGLATTNTGMGLGIGTGLATTNTGMGLGIGTSLATSNTGMGLGIGTSLATTNTGMGLGIGTSLATSNIGMGLGIGTSLTTANTGMGLSNQANTLSQAGLQLKPNQSQFNFSSQLNSNASLATVNTSNQQFNPNTKPFSGASGNSFSLTNTLNPSTTSPFNPQISTGHKTNSVQLQTNSIQFASQPQTSNFQFGSQTNSAQFASQPQSSTSFQFGAQTQSHIGSQAGSMQFASQPQTNTIHFGAQPQANSVQFGSQPNSGSQLQTSTFQFGSQPQTKPVQVGSQPQMNTFQLGSQPQANFGSQPQTSTFQFGSQPQTNSVQFGSQPQTNTFQLGSQPQANFGSQPQTSTFQFGSQPQTNSVQFGSQSQPNSGSQPQTNTFQLGSQPQTNTFQLGSQPQTNTFQLGSQPQMNTFQFGSQSQPNSVQFGNQSGSFQFGQNISQTNTSSLQQSTSANKTAGLPSNIQFGVQSNNPMPPASNTLQGNLFNAGNAQAHLLNQSGNKSLFNSSSSGSPQVGFNFANQLNGTGGIGSPMFGVGNQNPFQSSFNTPLQQQSNSLSQSKVNFQPSSQQLTPSGLSMGGGPSTNSGRNIATARRKNRGRR